MKQKVQKARQKQIHKNTRAGAQREDYTHSDKKQGEDIAMNVHREVESGHSWEKTQVHRIKGMIQGEIKQNPRHRRQLL